MAKNANKTADTANPAQMCDVLIIGGGVAGLSLALRLPESLSVRMILKGQPEQSNTWFAQGGISAVIDKRDSLDAHIEDTLRAGAGLCAPKVVKAIVSTGPEEIEWLRSMQVDFTTTRDKRGREELHLTREGGHSHRRVVHHKDSTGSKLQTSLMDAARARPNITISNFRTAIDLIVDKSGRECIGAYVLESDNRVVPYCARAVVLATGGVGKVYLYTSNPSVATGDGIAMAWRAGCRIANLEFMQFHPTCLYAAGQETVLLSEALRGEGAQLKLPDGERFMYRYDERGELATRDVVAFAIDNEMKRLGIESVYLDISHRDAGEIKKMFPTLCKKCSERGFDLTKEPVPVVPAAHYMCGGVSTRLNARTNIGNLYAIGEVAHTGLHGANRMASNSLLECLASARFAVKSIKKQLASDKPFQPQCKPWDESRIMLPNEKVITLQVWREVRHLMWNYVGIARTTNRLLKARKRIALIYKEIEEHYARYKVSTDFIELRNITTVASLIIRSALARKESRGLHQLVDKPETKKQYDGRDTVLKKRKASEGATREGQKRKLTASATNVSRMSASKR